MPEVIHFVDRTEVAKRHYLNFKNARLTFVDTPGQELRESRRKSAVRDVMKEDALGVINLVSFGYHENAANLEDAIGPKGKISKEYLETSREKECRAVGEWIHLLGSPDSTSWFMTVVNKADLWWDDRAEVLKYYQSGPYYQILGSLQNMKPCNA